MLLEYESYVRRLGMNEVRGVEWDVRAHGEEQQVGLIVVTTGSIYSKRLNGNNSQFPASFRQFHPAQFWEIDFTNSLWIFQVSHGGDRWAPSRFQLSAGPQIPFHQYRKYQIIFR